MGGYVSFNHEQNPAQVTFCAAAVKAGGSRHDG